MGSQYSKKLYRLSSKGKLLLWCISVQKNVIRTIYGEVDGKLQKTSDEVTKGKNIGKSNETTPSEQALLMAQRLVASQIKKGYTEKVPLKANPDITDEFFKFPPSNFVAPKPQSSIPDSILKSTKNLVYTRKHNGMCVHIVKAKGSNPRIYTANIDNKSLCFLWQIDDFIKNVNLPDNTWLMAEAVTDRDCPDEMKTVFGSLWLRAREEQEGDIGRVKFKVFNMLYYDGKLCDNMTWAQRYQIFKEACAPSEYFGAVDCVASQKKYADEVLQKNPSWEGLVAWDVSSKKIPIKWGGSPSRNGGAYKLKNFKEADVIITNWDYGRGKLNNDVATLHYGAYNEEGFPVHIGKGGSGLDADLRSEIFHEWMKLQSGEFLVAEVKYEEMTKAGKLRLPVILRLRKDKKQHDCLLEDIL